MKELKDAWYNDVWLTYKIDDDNFVSLQIGASYSQGDFRLNKDTAKELRDFLNEYLEEQ